MQYRRTSAIAQCIGCGCHDLHACAGGCSWLRVDYGARVGVCSQCRPHLARWDAGDRALVQREPAHCQSEGGRPRASAKPGQGQQPELPVCHFTSMAWESADNGYADVDSWWECLHCGHTRSAGTDTIGA
jgi:hypothetical protein